MSTSEEVENEVAFAALSGWEQGLKDALQDYCNYCKRISERELQRRPRVLVDFDIWLEPYGAAYGHPLAARDVAAAASFLAQRIRSKNSDPYAIISALRRECEK